MPRSFFDLNLLANMVAKLGNIVGEHFKFDVFANNVGQFGYTFRTSWKLMIPCSRNWEVLGKGGFTKWLWRSYGFLFGKILEYPEMDLTPYMFYFFILLFVV